MNTLLVLHKNSRDLSAQPPRKPSPSRYTLLMSLPDTASLLIRNSSSSSHFLCCSDRVPSAGRGGRSPLSTRSLESVTTTGVVRLLHDMHSPSMVLPS